MTETAELTSTSRLRVEMRELAPGTSLRTLSGVMRQLYEVQQLLDVGAALAIAHSPLNRPGYRIGIPVPGIYLEHFGDEEQPRVIRQLEVIESLDLHSPLVLVLMGLPLAITAQVYRIVDLTQRTRERIAAAHANISESELRQALNNAVRDEILSGGAAVFTNETVRSQVDQVASNLSSGEIVSVRLLHPGEPSTDQ